MNIRCSKQNNPKLGFTLIEILLVIAILMMLTSLLLPVFASVRARARSTSCLSNLQQIGTAISLYAQDYDDKYPLGANSAAHISAYEELDPLPSINVSSLSPIRNVLQTYAPNQNSWRCPSDAGSDNLTSINASNKVSLLPNCLSAFDTYGTSYLYRTNLGLQQVQYPASAYTLGQQTKEINSSEVGILTDMANWHGDKELNVSRQNVLFADGHVKNQKELQFIRCWFFPFQPQQN